MQRYLSGSSITESRMGLLVNGLVKVPMQFIILFIGAMVFVLYQFVTPPLFFNPVEEQNVKNSIYSEEYIELENDYDRIFKEKQVKIREMLGAIETGSEIEITEKTNDVLAKQEELSPSCPKPRQPEEHQPTRRFSLHAKTPWTLAHADFQ